MQKEGRKFAALLAALACLAIAGISIVNAETLDESQTDVTQAYSFLTGEAKAQSFRVDDGKWLYQVDFYYDPGDCAILKAWIDTDTNGSNGNLTYHIFNTSSWTAGWHTWDIRGLVGDIELNPGTAYYIILLPGVFTTNPAWYGSTSDVYANGRAWYTNESGWQPLDTVDYSFKIYTDVDPVANFTYYVENMTLYVNASTSYTPDGDPITLYEWDWDGDGIYDATGITANHTYSVAGTYTVKLRVTDEDSHTDIESKTIQIDPTNEAPTVELVSPADNATVGINVTLTCTVSDPDGDLMDITYEYYNAGVWVAWGVLENKTNGTYSLEVTNLSVNTTYTWRVKVTDGLHLVNSPSRNFTTSATETEEGGGWFTWKLPFSWFAIVLIIAIGVIGVSLSAFFLKKESIKALGYAPAAGTMLTTVFLVGTILLYHAGVDWYWLIIPLLLVALILFVTLKVVLVKKRKVAKTVFKIGKKKRRKR